MREPSARQTASLALANATILLISTGFVICFESTNVITFITFVRCHITMLNTFCTGVNMVFHKKYLLLQLVFCALDF